MKEIKKSFRSTYGLDAANDYVLNVKKPELSKEHGSYGINVEFFIDESTIQEYDKDRGYKKGFIISYKNKLFYSKFDIKKPAGEFSYASWAQVRTDPQAQLVSSGSLESPHNLISGDYISCDTKVNEIYFKLPDNPAEGDSIIIKDVGGNLGLKQAQILKPRHPISIYGKGLESFNLTRPYGTTVFLYIGGTWKVHQEQLGEYAKFIDRSTINQSQIGESLFAETSLGDIEVVLPLYANSGDFVKFNDITGKDSKYGFNIKLPAGSKATIGKDSSKEFKLYTTCTYMIFDSKSSNWKVFDLDHRERVKTVSSDYNLNPYDRIITFGPLNKERKAITLTLPEVSDNGSHITISNIYLRPGQRVTIKPFDQESNIMFNKDLLEFPKRSERPSTQDMKVLKQLVIDGTNDTYNSLELIYVHTDTKPYWLVSEYVPLIERVDPNFRQGLGVISLATQEQANVDKGSNPNKETAITPETLANRTATETRQGILRTAKESEVLIDSDKAHDKLIAVTPFTLNARTPTENRGGVVRIATQAEVNAGLVDDEFVSPKKLHGRTATESRTGIAALVKSGGIATIESRGKPGTEIYNFLDHSKIVTPKVLSELLSTPLAAGLVFVATESEVISGVSQDGIKFPAVVSPEELHKKTATEARIGFTQTASQAEVNTNANHFKYVTPKTLSGRTATTGRTGISKLATQAEFDAGNTTTISTPSVVKTRFKSVDRYGFSVDSGLLIDGSIWDKLNFDIAPSSLTQRGTVSLASGDETNKRVVDNKAVTPKSLASVVSSETNSGLIKVANLNEVIAGTSSNTAISPLNLFKVKNHATAWKSSTKDFGFLRLATQEESFVGTPLNGSTNSLELYDELNAVSPKGLNYALMNFLPKTATAKNSEALGGKKPAEYTVKALNEIVSGEWTFSNNQKFNGGITVVKNSVMESVTFNGSSPQILVEPKSNAVESSIGLNTKTKKRWDITTDLEALSVKYNDVSAIKILPKVTEFNDATIKGVNSLLVSDSISLKDKKFIYSSGASAVSLGDKSFTLNILAPDASNINVNDGVGYKLITTKNIIEETGKNFLNIKGGTLTGKLNINNASVNPNIKEGVSEKLISDNGIWTSNIVTKANFETFPPASGDRVISETGTTYENAVYNQGALANITSSKSNGVQFWIPSGSKKKYVRGSNIDGSWGEFDEILTTNNLPKPEEIGAISSSGLVYKDLKVQGWIQIGNLRIRPNPATKSVDFIWVEE